MSYFPVEELKDRGGISLAPMIDFLFLMLAVFASIAVSRVATKDTEIELVKAKNDVEVAVWTGQQKRADYKIINISVSSEGSYNWVTEMRDHRMERAEEIAQELCLQYEKGLLPEDKLKTQILLKIDKNAKWEPILKAILAIKNSGFDVRPVYEPESGEIL